MTPKFVDLASAFFAVSQQRASQNSSVCKSVREV